MNSVGPTVCQLQDTAQKQRDMRVIDVTVCLQQNRHAMIIALVSSIYTRYM